MDLLLLGLGMGVGGGLIPGPLHMIALAQVGLARWFRVIAILVGPPLMIDGAMLLLTLFFYQYVPRQLAHYMAYGGGVALLGFGSYSLALMRRKPRAELARSPALTYASVSAAALGELTAPGTWLYWIGIAGPILAEGHQRGYARVIPFFAGGLIGYYGAAIFAVWLMAWGVSLNKYFKERLYVAANLLLMVLGASYLVRARLRG